VNGRPKIRGLVQCLQMSPGVLFRYGESILPVRGNAVWEWYQRMKPSLEDPSLSAEQLAALASPDPISFGRICEALKAADMLYDASGDGPHLVPAAIQMRFRPQIARLELKSAHPLRAFATVRAKRVLILSAGDLAFALAEAALESGLGNIAICVPGQPSSAIEIAGEIRHRYADEASETVVEAMPYDACLDALSTDPGGHYLVAAGIAGREWRILENHLAPLLAAPGTTAYVACVGHTRVIAGTLDAPGRGGCSACLETYCAEGSAREHEALAASEISDSVGMSARLVIQHLWDVATELPGENTRHSIFDFDLASCTLQRRPRPAALVECSRCQLLPHLSTPHPWPFAGASGLHLTFRDLCRRAERFYVDHRTGLIAELDEGDLLQYPVYQCAALLNPNFCGRAFGWITECGDDMLMARVNAVRRALELLSEDKLRQEPAQETPVFYYSAELEFMGSGPSSASTGAVISALRPEDLRAEAFYRAVAQYAHSLDTWTDVDLEAIRPGGAANIIFEHLHETGVLRHVQVQQCVVGEEGCRVLRFLYQMEAVSVVAGPEWEPVWASGLRDVWLQVSALEATQDRAMDTRVRFRATGPVLKPDALLRQIRSAERASGRTLLLAPVLDTGQITALPLYLAFVSFEAEHRTLDGNSHNRWNTVPQLVPETPIQATAAGLSAQPARSSGSDRAKKWMIP
jgi:hypothetical protein